MYTMIIVTCRYELLGNSGSNLPSPSFDDVTTCDSYTACTDISMQVSMHSRLYDQTARNFYHGLIL